MAAQELVEILDSDELKKDLREQSSYLASIKQERSIIFSIARCLWKRGRVFRMEEKRRDLVVGETYLEFKYSYDCDMEKVEHEMERYKDKPILAMLEDVASGELSKGWSQCAPILEDMCVKKPQIFVWIIHSRDVSRVHTNDPKQINWLPAQRKWSKTHPYPDQSHLEIARRFLSRVNKETERRFRLIEAEIEGNEVETDAESGFPSSYHFMVCDFTITGISQILP